MSYGLTCPNCHQKTISSTIAGYTCARCGQNWSTSRAFIQALFDDLDQIKEPVGAPPSPPQPRSAIPANEVDSRKSASWFESPGDLLTTLSLKLTMMLLKFLPKFIFKLTRSLLTITINTLLLALITYPLLIGFNLWLKIRDRKLSPEKRTALQTTVLRVGGRLVLALGLGLILAIVTWQTGWPLFGILVSGLAGLMVGFLAWPALNKRIEHSYRRRE